MKYEYRDTEDNAIANSRPHHAPAFKRCCDSCINVPCKVLNRVPCLAQEKQENVCEENGCTDIENCDEICQHSRLFSPLQMQEAKDAAARQAREDVLNRLDEEIAIRENEMNQKGNLEDNLTTATGYFTAAGALNWVRVVLIDGSRDTIKGESLRGERR